MDWLDAECVSCWFCPREELALALALALGVVSTVARTEVHVFNKLGVMVHCVYLFNGEPECFKIINLWRVRGVYFVEAVWLYC